MSAKVINNFNNTTNNAVDFSTNLKEYTSRVKQAVAYSLWIRDTYSTSGYKQPLIAQPTVVPQRPAKDAPFDATDIEIYPDDYSGEIPINGIKEAEYQSIKTLYEDILQGRSTITFDPKLPQGIRRLLEMDLILLMTRPTSRRLLTTVCQRQVPLKLAQGAFRYLRYFNTVYVDPLMLKSNVSRERNDEENNFFSPSPHFIPVAHEFIHALFEHLHGSNTVVKFSMSNSTLDEKFDNLNEQLVITGESGEKMGNFDINEQQICREFGIPYREDHRFGGPFSPDASMEVPIPDEQLSSTYSNYDGGVFKDGQFPIRWATRHGAMLNIVHWLKTGGDVNLKFKGGRTLLHEAANGGNDKIAILLIDRGANVQAICDQGRSILHECACDSAKDTNKSRTELGILLLKKGVPIDLKDGSGSTPIQLAYKSNSKFASVLFDRGANVQAISVISAMENSDAEFVKRLFDSGASIVPFTADHRFKKMLEEKKYDMAHLLLKTGININYQEISLHGMVQSRTCLHNAVAMCGAHKANDLSKGVQEDEGDAKRRTEEVRFLLNHGADPSLPGPYDDTAFHSAYGFRDLTVLALLHEKDPTGHLIKPRFKKSVYELAQQDNWKEALDIFSQRSADSGSVKRPIPPENYRCKTPLALLSQSLIKQESKGIIISIFQRLESDEKNAIFKAVYEEAESRDPSDCKWGENHAFDDMLVLKRAVEKTVSKNLERLAQEERNGVYGKIYELAGSPQEVSPCWGEEHATEYLPLLADALFTQCNTTKDFIFGF